MNKYLLEKTKKGLMNRHNLAFYVHDTFQNCLIYKNQEVLMKYKCKINPLTLAPKKAALGAK